MSLEIARGAFNSRNVATDPNWDDGPVDSTAPAIALGLTPEDAQDGWPSETAEDSWPVEEIHFDGPPEPQAPRGPRERAPEEQTAEYRAEMRRQRVEHEAERLRVQHEARQLVARERTGGTVDALDAALLVDLLARPAGPAHRVEGLIPAEAGTLIVAQRKTGKTTLILNLARCLVTGENFLGEHRVIPVTGRVAILNYEVSGHTLAAWADEHGVPAERLLIVTLRGRRNPLVDPVDRAALAALLRQYDVEALIVDPFGRAYSGESQNDSGQVGAWLADLDTFARSEAGASDVILAAHAGWNGDRTRGSSALEDWADSIITMTRDERDESVRYLRATGRDVDVDEQQLTFDHATRALSLSGAGSRRQVSAERHGDALADAVVKAVTAEPGINGVQLAARLRSAGVNFRKGAESVAARQAAAAGRLVISAGPRNSKQYSPALVETPSEASPPPPPPTSPAPPPGEPRHLPRSPSWGGAGEVGTGAGQGNFDPGEVRATPDTAGTSPTPSPDYAALGASLFATHTPGAQQ